jgi:tryptophanyl-tRNA synthetase
MGNKNKVLLSGIQPSGALTIGNYLGALSQWKTMQADHHCFCFLADLHTITVTQPQGQLKAYCFDMMAMYLACGMDPKQTTLFLQSHVPEHTEMAWILSCHTMAGELNRMTQFKDKSKRFQDNINAGLWSYPALQAADILLYQPDVVPIGDDQRQHLELTRNIAQRFNHHWGDTFKLPEALYDPHVKRIMGLQTPEKKMSKSDDNTNNVLYLLDAPKVIQKKISRAVTDSKGVVAYHEDQPGLKNLIDMLAALTHATPEHIVSTYAAGGYGQLKKALSDAWIDTITPIQSTYQDLRSDEDALRQVLQDGAEKARETASKTLRSAKEKMGFIL